MTLDEYPAPVQALVKTVIQEHQSPMRVLGAAVAFLEQSDSSIGTRIARAVDKAIRDEMLNMMGEAVDNYIKGQDK